MTEVPRLNNTCIDVDVTLTLSKKFIATLGRGAAPSEERHRDNELFEGDLPIYEQRMRRHVGCLTRMLSAISCLSKSLLTHSTTMPKPQHVKPYSRISSDPLAAALQPPPNESPEDRVKRIQDELDAKRTSELIDDQLHKERNERKKARSDVNVLLLGQSESGKSTTLKRESARSSSLPSLYSVGRLTSPFSRPLAI